MTKMGMKRDGPQKSINKVSAKQTVTNKRWNQLVGYLKKERAQGLCEIPDCTNNHVLWGHHIIFRSRKGSTDTAGNCIILCSSCHNHDKYPNSGCPLSTEDALLLVAKKNKLLGLDNIITYGI